MQINENEIRAALARDFGPVWRVFWRVILLDTIQTSGDFDFSLAQFATLLLLEEEGELTVKRIAELLGRSVSATSRMLEQLVTRDLVRRREDERDRRARLLSLTENGRQFLRTLGEKRTATQVELISQIPPAERAVIVQALHLLSQGARRRLHEHIETRTTTGKDE